MTFNTAASEHIFLVNVLQCFDKFYVYSISACPLKFDPSGASVYHRCASMQSKHQTLCSRNKWNKRCGCQLDIVSHSNSFPFFSDWQVIPFHVLITHNSLRYVPANHDRRYTKISWMAVPENLKASKQCC